MKHRFLYIMALLLTAASAWADDEPAPIDLTKNTDGTVWTLPEGMPAYDVELEVVYKTDLTLSVSIEGWTYGGTAATPSVTGNTSGGAVTYEYKLKSAGDDAYSADVPTDVGTYTIRATVAETDDYADGTATADFTIAPMSLTDAMIQTIADQTYTGSALTPEITVTDGETTLVLNTDYENVVFTNNTNAAASTDASAPTVTITGKGNYSGSASKTFTIAPKSLTDGMIQTITDQIYTGAAIEPAVVVKDGETTLVLNTDYTVAYSNNVETGTATVTVTGTGNYSGTATANFTILADKTALNTAITEAETYYNSIKDDHAAAAALKTAIDNAKAMQEKGDATQEEVNNALSALTTAKTTAEGAVLTDTKNKLNDDITAAEAYYESIKDGHTTAANTLKEAIDEAKGVKDNAGATQEQVDAAIAALASAKTTAEQTVLTETKSALNDDITEAEAYYNSIKDSNPAAAATLLDAINAAKTVKDNADATQSEIETAAQTLTDALNAAKADVALKRITLTIPAKSYMARIDADKRQIETAVTGVKLYSVKSVTNTEVELTAELSVIAAEMPYFIYNDNDTEVEVSIIVSSEDADNVDYDSDHFLGTLTDKTFTDADMAAANYYVCNGKEFIKVRGAGTLAANKAYLKVTGNAPASIPFRRSIDGGEGTTGIDNVNDNLNDNDAAWYDLGGRKLNGKPAQKGVYIKNGKKIVVK